MISNAFFIREDGATYKRHTDWLHVLAEHKEFKNFILIDEEFLVAPSDSTGETGQIAVSTTLTATEAGFPMVVKFWAVFVIQFDAKKGHSVTSLIDGVATFNRAGLEAPLTSAEQALVSFVSHTVFETIVENDDEIFNALWKRDVSPDIIGMYVLDDTCVVKPQLTLYSSSGGQTLNYQELYEAHVQTRKLVQNRRLLNQKYLANVGDDLGRSGQVATKETVSGIQNGKRIQFRIWSVIQVEWVESLGRSQVVRGSFVTDDADL